jgi:hypothetical protein
MAVLFISPDRLKFTYKIPRFINAPLPLTPVVRLPHSALGWKHCDAVLKDVTPRVLDWPSHVGMVTPQSASLTLISITAQRAMHLALSILIVKQP